jgi:hypothetical protein
MPKIQMTKTPVSNFEHYHFGFIWDLVLRVWNVRIVDV